jgi:hypothetical protein
MSVVIRPRFGVACFCCGDTVPKPRVDQFRRRAEELGRAVLKSEILCGECERKRLAENQATIEPRARF